MNVDVGMGEVAWVRPPDILRTNLGSCVGICFYDPIEKWAGLAHVVLPEKMRERDTSPTNFAEGALRALMKGMLDRGCEKHRFVCTIAGGGCMFPGVNYSIDIGARNVEAVKKFLAKESIPVVREEVGGTCSTSIVMDAETGGIKIDRKESNLRIVIQKEIDYQKKWVDHNSSQAGDMEKFLIENRDQYFNPKTKVFNSDSLQRLIRLYSATKNSSRLLEYVVYSKIASSFRNITA